MIEFLPQQVGSGFSPSLPVAAAHNAGAAMLLLALVGLNYALWNNEPRLSLP
jgi:hypothetical protein